ncbi:MAG TPA: N-acetyltransferase family protein [Syntrophales bacterium]|nr:N-acetyltransferase family protein [Syntrophales bacterium]
MNTCKKMKTVLCTHKRHALPILGILNEAIENSTAIYDYKARSPESMVGWFKDKEAGRFPVVGLESDEGELLGFASFGPFRSWPAYKYTVEHSVYVHHAHRGHGLGLKLMHEILEMAKARGVHVLVGGIDASNDASIALHTKLGFVHAGTIKQAGFKFGRWLDLAFYQLTLQTPLEPVDG